MAFSAVDIDRVIKACQGALGEAADIIGRAIDQKLTMSVVDQGGVAVADLEDGLAGPGLGVAFEIDGSGAIAFLPQASELLPAWYTQPDPTGKSKLETLAVELGVVLIPEDYMPSNAKASAIRDGKAALGKAVADPTSIGIRLELAGEAAKGELVLVWPVQKPVEFLSDPPKPAPAPKPAAAAPPKPAAAPIKLPTDPHEELERELPKLPQYTKSLLKIKLPVTVTLAQTRTTISRVLELGPGTIIQFDKSCDELLTLSVNGNEVAEGEAVKVGDKFGLRVSNMIMPPERFLAVRNKAS